MGAAVAFGSALNEAAVLMWANELGKGNSHTLDDIPFIRVGHRIETFGKPELCSGGVLPGLMKGI